MDEEQEWDDDKLWAALDAARRATTAQEARAAAGRRGTRCYLVMEFGGYRVTFFIPRSRVRWLLKGLPREREVWAAEIDDDLYLFDDREERP